MPQTSKPAPSQNTGCGVSPKNTRPSSGLNSSMEKLPASTAEASPQYRYELARTFYFLGRGGPPDAAPATGKDALTIDEMDRIGNPFPPGYAEDLEDEP